MAATYFEGETFRELSFSGERFAGLTLVDCAFERCTFEGCVLSRCTLTQCRFLSCRVTEPKLEYSQAKFLELTDCALTNVNWSLLLPSGGFGEPLEKLSDCRMKYNYFTNMDLRKFDFQGSQLTACLFGDCNLAEARFHGCGLTDTEFFRCALEGADFREAVGYKVDVPSCGLKGARFTLPEAASLLNSLGIRLE